MTGEQGEKAMASKETLECMAELYQGEIFGELFFEGLPGEDDDPDARRVRLALIQAEAETKIRLRPAMERLGVPVAPTPETRASVEAALARYQGAAWPDIAAGVLAAVRDRYGPRYREIAQLVQADGDPIAIAVANHMVAHEKSLEDMLGRHIAGDPDSTRPVDALLRYPMSAPAPAAAA
jgi:hypothetical protein